MELLYPYLHRPANLMLELCSESPFQCVLPIILCAAHSTVFSVNCHNPFCSQLC